VSASLAIRRPRKSVIVLANDEQTSDRPSAALAASLAELGVETVCLGHERSASRIASVVADEQADGIELYLDRGGVLLLRDLLRELNTLGRRDVSIVVHRVP
jgi:methylmalonyl-CoA mutase cobalamin-binding subunit